MTERADAPEGECSKVAAQEPDLLVPWSEIESTCNRIMKEADELTADSKDYRIGQWMGADKVLFALDCVAERMRLTKPRSEKRTFEDGLEAAAVLADQHPFSGTDLSRRIRALKNAAAQVANPPTGKVGSLGADQPVAAAPKTGQV